LDTPTNEPLELRAGDTWEWRREDLADYPAPTWLLSYYFKRHDANFNFNAAADGIAHAVSVPAATSAGFAPGLYSWFAFVVSGAERFEVDRGDVNVLPNLGVAGNLDNRSHARKVLDAIRALIEGRASLDQKSYTIGNRSLERIPIPELLQLRSVYEAEVMAEERAAALDSGQALPSRKIQVRF
jgi:hypothetical protein